jgi:transcriptional regulator with XRE-family HTH domain
LSTNRPAHRRPPRTNEKPDVAAADFGARLREARTKQNRTLRDVSLNAKVSIAYLSDLERGRLSNPTLDKLRAIATELGISVDDLLGATVEEGVEPRVSERRERSEALVSLGRSGAFRQAVREQAQRFGREPAEIADEWLDALAGIEIAGRRPETTSDYMFIFEAARRAVDR